MKRTRRFEIVRYSRSTIIAANVGPDASDDGQTIEKLLAMLCPNESVLETDTGGDQTLNAVILPADQPAREKIIEVSRTKGH